MTYIFLVGWWLVGTASLLWLMRDWGPITYGRLLGAIACGFLGPVLWVVIVFVFLAQADFWDKPVFPQRERGR